jgi:nucleotide-binding universal stress UspA family protein
MQEEEAQGVLASGHAALTQLGLASTTKLMTGFAGNRILARSEEGGADLLALGSSGRGLLNGAKLGSVGRKALTSAKCSVLIAKNAPSQGRPLTAVIATDHSQYANRCLEKLMSWNPKGIGRAVVTTVYPEQLLKSMTSLMNHFKADVSSWVKGELERNNAEFIRKFATVVPNCTGRVESGDVGDTLERVMKEEGADLLILGSQGHGFLERMFVGSISLDQAMSRSYSTLVVRA